MTTSSHSLRTNVNAIELGHLSRRYRDEAGQRARERLVLAWRPLVSYAAGRIGRGLPSHVDEAELVSHGLLGLGKAVERFDPARKLRFETFAGRRIRGQILDELRKLDSVPRSVRAKARDIGKANAALQHEPNSSVVALDEPQTLSDSSSEQVSLLDTIQDHDAVDPVTAVNQTQIKDRLADAVERLPEREQLVVALYYYENLTLREIADMLGVAESRVSQMRTKAVLRLKSRIEEDRRDLPVWIPPGRN